MNPPHEPVTTPLPVATYTAAAADAPTVDGPDRRPAWAPSGTKRPPPPRPPTTTLSPAPTSPKLAALPPAEGPTHHRRGAVGLVATVDVPAAALAKGGTLAVTRYAFPASSAPAAGTTRSTGLTSSLVLQGNAASPDWTAAAKVGRSVVSIAVASKQAQGQGSGVVIDNQGHILTNNHVATGAGPGATLSVTLQDSRTFDATITGTDWQTDLAARQIKNPPSDLVPVAVGDSAALTVGQPVMAVDPSLGLSGTVTTGIIGALNRPVTTQATGGSPGQLRGSAATNAVVTSAIQTSPAINPGNAGGALIAADGKLIGINRSIASLDASSVVQSGNIGIGCAIPVNEARSIVDQLIAAGTARHAYTGISTRDTTVTTGGSKRQAALIHSVSAGTPAASAGPQRGDAVIAIDGQPVDSSESLIASVHVCNVGDTVTLAVIRGWQQQDLKVTPTARPA